MSYTHGYNLVRVPRGPKTEWVFHQLCRIGLRGLILIRPITWILTKPAP